MKEYRISKRFPVYFTQSGCLPMTGYVLQGYEERFVRTDRWVDIGVFPTKVWAEKVRDLLKGDVVDERCEPNEC